VITWWLLVVGGGLLAGVIASGTSLYGLSFCVCLFPACLFMKFRVDPPMTWTKFIYMEVFLFAIGVSMFILDRFGILNDEVWYILLILIALICHFISRKN
jgi:hypothetical protein